MEICPVCNGLFEFIKYCPRCGGRMDILDRVENYYDNYSPYLSYELTDLNDGDTRSVCSHICRCQKCGFKDTAAIRNIIE